MGRDVEKPVFNRIQSLRRNPAGRARVLEPDPAFSTDRIHLVLRWVDASSTKEIESRLDAKYGIDKIIARHHLCSLVGTELDMCHQRNLFVCGVTEASQEAQCAMGCTSNPTRSHLQWILSCPLLDASVRDSLEHVVGVDFDGATRSMVVQGCSHAHRPSQRRIQSQQRRAPTRGTEPFTKHDSGRSASVAAALHFVW